MKRLHYPEDRKKIEALLRRDSVRDAGTEETVRKVIEDVRREGDRAVARYTRRFDRVRLQPGDFRLPRGELKKAWNRLDADLQKALRLAHERIRAYHEKQMLEGFTHVDRYGNRMEQRVGPVARAGVYVPGGTAAYPSTVLMDVVPAKVAGVREVVMITPPRRAGSDLEAGMLASWGAAWLAGVDEIYCSGGAQGVAAAALGTETLPRVDVIVGPGNRFVAAAKKLLYGEISIDMVAGPSEVLILADASASPRYVAADMLAQAEHDADAQSVAVLIGKYDVEALQKEIRRQTADAPRKEIIRQSLRRNGGIIQVANRKQAVELANLKAPEHLEIITRNPRALADKIPNVGAVFLGPSTTEAMGDYVLGPNHTLPTGGSARFYSPLSVWSFLKTSHVVECTDKGFAALADAVITLAETEGLHAHAAATRARLAELQGKKKPVKK